MQIKWSNFDYFELNFILIVIVIINYCSKTSQFIRQKMMIDFRSGLSSIIENRDEILNSLKKIDILLPRMVKN